MAALLLLTMMDRQMQRAPGRPPERSAAEQDRMNAVCQRYFRNGLLGGGGAALLISAAFPKGSVGRICALIPGIIATVVGLVLAVAIRFFSRDTRYEAPNLPRLRGELLLESFAQILREHDLEAIKQYCLAPLEVLREKLKGELFLGGTDYFRWVDREGDAWAEAGILSRERLQAIRDFIQDFPKSGEFGNRLAQLQVNFARLP